MTPVGQKIIGDRAGLVDQSSGVVAHVEHDTAQIAAVFTAQFAIMIEKFRVGAGLERLDAQVTDAAFEEFARQARHGDHLTSQRQVEQLFRTGAANGEQHVAAGLAAHLAHEFDRGACARSRCRCNKMRSPEYARAFGG